ncbi:MAG TPA: hypothetical protein PKK55_02615 [Methanofastidiosum sp.]|nr:hypothetical protein [Methanofastidiosum sp.]HOC78640.1 hypothetical protein [Methanofastidiosum sp.]
MDETIIVGDGKQTISMAERNQIIMDLRKQFTEKFVLELKQQNPDWSDTKIRGVAETMAQKYVSQNTQWNVNVVGKTPPNKTFQKIGIILPGKERVIYKTGKGEETVVKKGETVPKVPKTETQTTSTTKKTLKEAISDIFKKKQ